MYNLFVSGRRDAWNGEPYELEIGRCVREHTADAISDKYKSLDDASVAELLKMPALFAYENFQQKPARIGRLTRIRHRANAALIEYQLDPSGAQLPAEEIIKRQWDLDVTDWEMNRTHWAVKDVDLFQVLVDAGLLDPTFLAEQSKSIEVAANFAVQPRVFKVPDKRQDPNLVSIMMPYAGFDAVYAALKGAAKKVGVRCERADKFWEESEVMQDIFSLIYCSRFVICDFTGSNPNVFYEAGIAHTLGREVIPIAQNPEDVPFDLRHHRYIRYLNNNEGLGELTLKVAQRLEYLLKMK